MMAQADLKENSLLVLYCFKYSYKRPFLHFWVRSSQNPDVLGKFGKRTRFKDIEIFGMTYSGL